MYLDLTLLQDQGEHLSSSQPSGFLRLCDVGAIYLDNPLNYGNLGVEPASVHVHQYPAPSPSAISSEASLFFVEVSPALDGIIV